MSRDLKMPNINLVVIDGNITREPELKHYADGKPVCKIGIAHEEYRKGETITDFWDVTVFGKQAEALAEKGVKGQAVYVEGRLSTSRWTDDKGEHSRVEIIANKVRSMSWPKSDGTIGTEAKVNASTGRSAPQYEGTNEIPF